MMFTMPKLKMKKRKNNVLQGKTFVVNQTKQNLKNMKYEFNKGLNQLRNMPVNMR